VRARRGGQARGGEVQDTDSEQQKSPRARDASYDSSAISDSEISAAKDWDSRGLMCLRVLQTGRWDVEVPRLLRLWECTEPALSTYKRAGRVALAAIGQADAAERLEALLAGYWLEAEECDALAKQYAQKRPTLASRYRELRRKALEEFAKAAGLVQQKVSVSIEVDPRFAGVYRAINAALDEQDRLERERSSALRAWVAEVALLTDGVLPPGMPEELPPARARVVAAVQDYERQIGARAMGARGS